jgi:hypothetical protein
MYFLFERAYSIGFIVGICIYLGIFYLSDFLFKDYDNRYINFIKIYILRGLITAILVVLCLLSGIYFDLAFFVNILDIYCDGEDDNIFCENNAALSGNNQSANNDKVYSLNIEVNQDLGNKTVNVLKKVLGEKIDEVATNIGIGSAAGVATGSVGTAVMKSGLPPLQKAAVLAGATFITAASTTLGVNIVKTAIKNKVENDKLIKPSPLGDEGNLSLDNNFIPSLMDNDILSPL